MNYTVDPERLFTCEEVDTIALDILTELDEASKNKEFRKRLIGIIKGGIVSFPKRHKRYLINFAHYKWTIDSEIFTSAYKNQVPDKVDGDMEIVYEISVPCYGVLTLPVWQFSIPAQRNSL